MIKKLMVHFRLLVGSLLFFSAYAQLQPIAEDQGITGLGLALRKLPTIGSLLYVTAHPDDENNAVLAKVSRGLGVRTALLTLTRGDGGQNEIGPELFEALGILRSEELMAIHRYDGVEQFFTRAYEFGYSFSVEETFEKWGKEEILRDMVRVIRLLRPHVMLSLNPGGTGGGQHHQASARLALEAFRRAGDPNSFPDQITGDGLRPWQPLRIYQASGPGQFFRQDGGGDPAVEGVIIDLSSYDPLLGQSYAEFGSQVRNNHRSQGMNALPQQGVARAFYRLAESKVQPPGRDRGGRLAVATANGDFFEGIDTSLAALASDAPELGPRLRDLQHRVGQAQASYRNSNYDVVATAIMSGLKIVRAMQNLTQSPEAQFFLKQKEKDFLAAASKAHFIHFDALVRNTKDGTVVPGQNFEVDVQFSNRLSLPVTVQKLQIIAPPGWEISIDQSRQATQSRDRQGRLADADPEGAASLFKVKVSPDAQYTQPYWYRADRRVDRYSVKPAFAGHEPFPKPALVARVEYLSSGVSAWLEAPVVYRWFDAESAKERRMEVKVVPAVSVSLKPDISVIGGHSRAKHFNLTVRNNVPGPAKATARLVLPAGWKSEPEFQALNFRYENEAVTVRFSVQIPSDLKRGDYTVEARVEREGKAFNQGYQSIAYHHIQTRHLYQPASATIKAFELKVPVGLRVGYVRGVGDDVGFATEELGADVTYLQPEDLASGDLSQFDVIVTGVRAYLNRSDLIANNSRLLEYVQNGGHLVVQYNKYEFNEAQYGPYPAKINEPHDRVTAEDSTVKVLAPDHPIFNSPNQITEQDWSGWVQERGLYFLGQWDERYQPLLELQDPFPYNKERKRGALLIAQYGKGTYLYTGLGFFRQLPEGIPGAYRLWANILSLGKIRRGDKGQGEWRVTDLPGVDPSLNAIEEILNPLAELREHFFGWSVLDFGAQS